MRKQKFLLGLLAAVLVIGVPAVAAAHAGHAEHDRSVPTSTNEATTGQTTEGNSTAAQEAAKFRAHGQELLTQLKKDRQEHTKQQRREHCQTRRQGLQTKVDRLAGGVQKHKSRIDDVLAKVTAYQQQNNLNVENFEMLVTNATAAQATAGSSVAALGSLKPTVDCNNESVASDVAAFKVAAAQARSDLSEYRQTVKALLGAVRAAKNGDEQ